MRQQLLASAMEQEHEMGADIVSLLHIAPGANKELLNRVTSPSLKVLGDDIHSAWKKLTALDRFMGIHLEDHIPAFLRNAPNRHWAEYMQLRYGNMA